MRCASIKENKCWNRIEFELTSNNIWFLIDLFHIDVVHLSLLKRVGLIGSLNFLFWAFICIMPHLLALETFNLTKILLDRLASTTTSTSIVVVLVPTLVILVLVIFMTTVMFVVMMTVVVVVFVVLTMLAGSRIPTIIIMGTLVRRSRAVLVRVVFPLSAFNLFHLALQDGSLVTKRLIGRDIGHR